MLFNSLAYAAFLPVVFAAYWSLARSRPAQNMCLLVASYFFYGWWDWRFLGLILVSSAVDYCVGRGLATTSDGRARRALLAASLGVNLGVLAAFKYWNFFAEEFAALLGSVGLQAGFVTLNVVLPVGISFYTFQTLGYSIDVYRGRVEPARDPIAFFAFVAFFPQLVAGPIERAARLLPQFQSERRFDAEGATDGLRQILWGLFKKVVVADSVAPIVDAAFGSNPVSVPPAQLLFALVLFAFQIYGDFSGYSDIALGTARLFGFDLARNFAYPYFARDLGEFWRRWHISLSTWFRDYVYIPLGGSRGPSWLTARNVMITFMISGLWHGAEWTFVVWGAVSGAMLLPALLTDRHRRYMTSLADGGDVPAVRDLGSIARTFVLTTFGWLLFRAESMTHAVEYLTAALGWRGEVGPVVGQWPWLMPIVFMLAVEWWNRREQHGLGRLPSSRVVRWAGYSALLAAVLATGREQQPFIYFQF